MISSDRLNLYLNQTIQYEAQSDYDRYGHVTYAKAVPVKARVEHDTRLMTNTSGETVTTNSKVWTVNEVKPNDRINGSIVINSFAMVNRQGKTIGWEAYI